MKELTQEEIENIRKDPKNLDWFGLCYDRKLSENFIKEFKNKICWPVVSMCQTLSEDFIREFQDQVNWYFIFHRQSRKPTPLGGG